MLAASLAVLALAAPQPTIVHNPIPYGPGRRAQMAAYSKRHYGFASSKLRPRVIVLHFTANNSYSATWNTFASNAANRGEKPGTCSHFVIEKNGRIHQLVPLGVRCRHTVGLNHVAIGIEMVQQTGQGAHWADQQILHRPKQINAALRLVRWLQGKYHIRNADVVGHATANSHRLFKDLEGWRNDHVDWQLADVRAFRRRL
jgi:N-acetyl-anhydromuramyl-L-alanine amidase AmpD